MKTKYKIITVIAISIIGFLFIPVYATHAYCDLFDSENGGCMRISGIGTGELTFYPPIFVFDDELNCDEICVDMQESQDANSGWITDEDIQSIWVTLPMTSCGYPWHESNHEQTKQYYQDYRNIFGNYDSSEPQENADAMHYVITRYYEDLGKTILDVKTSYDHSVAGMGDECNTTVGGIWHLKIQNTDLDYFLDSGFIEQELESE